MRCMCLVSQYNDSLFVSESMDIALMQVKKMFQIEYPLCNNYRYEYNIHHYRKYMLVIAKVVNKDGEVFHEENYDISVVDVIEEGDL